MSARTPAALRVYAGLLAAHLATVKDEDYPAFAYTLTHGRAALATRVRVAAADKEQARAALEALAEDQECPVAEFLSPGAEPSFAGLPRRVMTLPAYPWERRRYAPPAAERP